MEERGFFSKKTAFPHSNAGSRETRMPVQGPSSGGCIAKLAGLLYLASWSPDAGYLARGIG
jgi:hypothetical protein